MIKVENIEVYNIARAVYSARNALNSWDKSDSDLENDVLGEADLDLAKRLFAAGSVHRKFLRQIFVSMDVIAPLFWWKEADQYRVGVTTNSCSTMHKLMERPFEMNDFSFDKLPGYKREIKTFVPEVTEDMEESEEWLSYDNEYDVSNYGRIRHNFKNHSRIIGGSKHSDGYIVVTLHGKQIPLHRIIAKLFHPDSYAEELVVNHIDGNKQNNFAENLEWVTQQDNIIHSIKNHLQPKSTHTYLGKFSQEERDEIKKLWNDGCISMRSIATEYGVSYSCIRSVIHDKYRYAAKENLYENVARPIVDTLNELRDAWIIEQNEEEKKKIWYSVIALMPISYNQRRTLTMNYENVANIIEYRSDHRLSEWRELCEILKDLPYVREIGGIEDE